MPVQKRVQKYENLYKLCLRWIDHETNNNVLKCTGAKDIC